MIGRLIGIGEIAAGIAVLYKAFLLHNYLEGPLTALGVYIGAAAFVGFVILHDGLHRTAKPSYTPDDNREVEP